MEALIGRVGADRYRMWFSHGVKVSLESSSAESPLPTQSPERIILTVRGQFALDRLRQNFLRELRGAAMQACGTRMEVLLRLEEPVPTQAELPLDAEPASCESQGGDQPTRTAAGSASRKVSSDATSDATGNGPAPRVTKLTDAGTGNPTRRKTKSNRRRTQSISALIAEGQSRSQPELRIDQPQQLEFPVVQNASGSQASTAGKSKHPSSHRNDQAPSDKASYKAPSDQAPSDRAQQSSHPLTASNFVSGTSNQLAYTAMSMVCQEPRTASPIFFCGPTGTGKTHLLSAIADQMRRRHRMRRVMHLSAEQFTNDFISSVGNSGITAFRRRYREVDALLIDDVQFLGAKKATLREMLYTVETLASEGRPLLFSGLQAPTEIAGLSRELAGRMAGGLVCPIQPLDSGIRQVILNRWLEQRCPLHVPEALVNQINPMLAGDGRVVSGVVNMVNTLQRMFGRVPSLDEIRQFGGNLLRSSAPIATLSVIETAVCDAFHLPHNALRGRSQTRAVTGPRMLAMYLARQLTSSAYSEIATHFGGKSHSTAISAENNVKNWLEAGKSIGRGQIAMSTQQAIAQVENLLRSG